MRRGEVWWAQLPQPLGTRPVLLLSRDEAYSVRESVTVAPVTTRKKGLPVEVILTPREGVPKECVVNVDSMATIERALLKNQICALSTRKMDEVNQAIKFALALP